MDYVTAIGELASRMNNDEVLKQYYEMGKKLIKKSRCAPACRPDRKDLQRDELPNEICVTVRNRRGR